MKKSTSGFLLGLAGAVVLSAGVFASEPTVDEILEQYQTAGTQISDVNADVDMNASVRIVVPDLPAEEGTFAIDASAKMDMGLTINPLQAQVSADFNAQAMGEGGAMNMDMYMVQKEDNAIGIYVNANLQDEETGWQYVEIPAEVTSQLLDAIAKGQTGTPTLEDYPIDFTLGEGTVEANGHDCYQLLATLTWTDLKDLINYAMEQAAAMTDEATAEQFEQINSYLSYGDAFLGGLNINIEIDVDTETYLPARAHFDTDGSDWTVLGAMFASYAHLNNDDGSLMNVDINVDSLYLDYLYDYETPVAITIPEEAIAAEAEGIVLDEEALEEAMTELG